MPALIEKTGRIEIWRVREPWGFDYVVYDGLRLVRTCPSIGMAREVAAGA